MEEKRHTKVGHQACVGPGTSWAPQRQFISVREDKTAHASMKVRGSCLHGFTPKVLESSTQTPRRPKYPDVWCWGELPAPQFALAVWRHTPDGQKGGSYNSDQATAA